MNKKVDIRNLGTKNPVKHVRFWCPGCNEYHLIPIEGKVTWDFNNDLYKPTLNPSIKTTNGVIDCCHSFVRDGYIEFLSDCTHKLAGQKVELSNIEDD